MDRIDAASPRNLARMAGFLYLLNIVGGFFAIGFVPTVIVASGDAVATAHNLQTSELLYRSGLAAHIVILVTNVGLAAIFYELFRVVNRTLALLVVFFTLVGTAVEGAGVLNQFGSLVLLNSGPYSGVFTAGQLRALAYLPVDTQGISYDVYTVFFGFYALTIGYLVFRSTFLPRLVGVLIVLDGLAYLTNSFAAFLAPGFAVHLVPWIQLPALFGEGSLCVGLLVMGVNGERWTRVSVAAGMPALEGDRRWS